MNTLFWQRVREAFDAATDAPPDAIDAIISAHTGGDAAIAREVRALLAHDQGNFLDAPVPFPIEADLFRSQLTPDTTFEGYRIVRLVGRGGMGEVYEAVRDGTDFQKRVAVKVLRAGAVSSDAIRRFQQERRILAGLEHRNIAAMTDGGVLSDGRPFLVMEYVEGTRLTTWCTTHRLSIDARLGLFRQVCGAVSHAHRHLVVHRDIKPGNILVTDDGTIKLVDFGIAKVLDPVTDLHSSEPGTHPAAAALTPEYAAPEQLAGGAVTTQTDLFALGLLLFELLSGSRPFAEGSPTLPELTRLVLTTDPPLPSSVVKEDLWGAQSAAVRRALRGDLDAIILKMLRLEPRARYGTVEQLLDDLRRHERGLPVDAMRGHRGYRAGKFIRRHRVSLLAAGAVAVALVSGVVVTIRESRLTAIQRNRAESTNRFLTEMLSSVDPGAAGKEVPMVEVLDSAAARIRQDSTLDPEVEASLQTAIGTSYRALGKLDQALPHLERAVILQTQEHHDPVRLAQAYWDLAQTHDGAGRYQVADSLYQVAQRILPSVGDSSLQATTTALISARARMRSLRGDLPGAETILVDVVHRQEAQYGHTSLEAANALSQLGVTVAQQYHFAPAESLTRAALNIYRQQRTAPHPDIGKTLGRLATVLEQSGNRPAADSAYRESLQMLDATLGADHPDVAWIRVNYAGFLMDGKEWDAAIREADSVLRFRGTTIPDTHPGISVALQMRALSLAGRGDHAEAVKAFRETLALRRKVMPSGHWTIGSTESFLGQELLSSGERAEGMALMYQGCRVITKALGPQHPNAKSALARLTKAGEAHPTCQ